MKLDDYLWNLDFMEPHQEIRVEKWMVNEPLTSWVIHVGKEPCWGHYRKGVYHARDMRDHYLIHRDNEDAIANPGGHLARDAPDVLDAGLKLGVLFGLLGLAALLIYALSK